MPISSIIQQPTANQLLAAYRPVKLTVDATATGGGSTPPVVHCDIYFNGKYYKTISKTVYSEYLGASTRWSFDIQDACQEFLTKIIGSAGGIQVINATGALVKVFCRFRSSGLDGNGFILSEGTTPVQGTLLTQPVAGTGTASNLFFVVNATLRHSDNQNLVSSLALHKTGSWHPGSVPLTRRPDLMSIGLKASDYFPVATDQCYEQIRLSYRYKGESTFRRELRQVGQPCDGVITVLDGFPDPGGGSINITWTAEGDIINFDYQVDGGPVIQTTDMFINLTGLAAGAHVFTITPVCNCGSGAVQTLNFTIS